MHSPPKRSSVTRLRSAPFKTVDLNGVIWTLVHEMRISIIFPFVVLLLMARKWGETLLALPALSALSALTIAYAHINAGDTLHYLSFFILGMLIAKFKNERRRLPGL
ncbi:acyltransferase family protein [Cohnella sp. GCM10020058]|uniref:acyltransferase family protein n=1 Tax=Cohnella sp. GCM10020058 TaxID=3317330 RepID=UPI00363CFAD7